MLAQLVRDPLRRHSLARRARSALQRGQALDRGAQAVLDRRRRLRGHAKEANRAALRIAVPHGEDRGRSQQGSVRALTATPPRRSLAGTRSKYLRKLLSRLLPSATSERPNSSVRQTLELDDRGQSGPADRGGALRALKSPWLSPLALDTPRAGHM